ncbi:amidohydrolase family protein [Comamonadaceae bacterium G21597-S1]|nr:amidohydrolase family protein [Comamonadaceae bacterium G21597-S1]
MKIDTHQHFWFYHAPDFPWIDDSMTVLQRDCMPGHHAAAMQAAGIDAVVAVQARTLAAETDFLLQLADRHPEVAGVVGWADLAAADLDRRLDTWCAHPAFKGLRHILQDEPDVPAWVDAPGIAHGMRVLQRHQRVYDVLVFDHQIAAVAGFCARHDAHWLVIDHVGKPALRDWDEVDGLAARRWSRDLRAIAALPHVMCKLSGVVTETGRSAHQGLTSKDRQNILACFDEALAAFGPQRLMYGSDWPVCQLVLPYDVVHGLAHHWATSRLSPQEQDAFWSGNAIRCYGLDPRVRG